MNFGQSYIQAGFLSEDELGGSRENNPWLALLTLNKNSRKPKTLKELKLKYDKMSDRAKKGLITRYLNSLKPKKKVAKKAPVRRATMKGRKTKKEIEENEQILEDIVIDTIEQLPEEMKKDIAENPKILPHIIEEIKPELNELIEEHKMEKEEEKESRGNNYESFVNNLIELIESERGYQLNENDRQNFIAEISHLISSYI